MQADDTRVCEAGDAGESDETQGTSPVPVRLTQDVHGRVADDHPQGVLAEPVRGEEAVAPRDVCYSGSFNFVSEALEVVDESVLESFSYALNDIESTLDDIEMSLVPHVIPACFSLIKSFIEGDRVGFMRLRGVHPGAFKSSSAASGILFSVVSDILKVVNESSLISSFEYAMNDIESTLDDIEISLAPHIFPVCVSLVKSFVQGGRVGLARLKKVLPSIFSSFSVGSPYDVLLECGLIPEYSHACNGYPSFFFHPDLDGCQMIERLEPAMRKRKRDIPMSEQLQQTYESARSSWTSPPPSESNS